MASPTAARVAPGRLTKSSARALAPASPRPCDAAANPSVNAAGTAGDAPVSRAGPAETANPQRRSDRAGGRVGCEVVARRALAAFGAPAGPALGWGATEAWGA